MTDNTINDAAPADTSDDQPKQSRSKGWKLFIRDVLLILLAALLISFLIKTFLIRSFYIPSSSMEETLQIDDRIIVNQLTPELMPLEHGDVVVFRDPGGWLSAAPSPPPQNWLTGAVDGVLSFVGLTAPDSNEHLIKRIIGMPGDTVVCCNDLGQLTVNGVPLDEPYITLPADASKATRDDFEITVPEGYLWVMGDNRYNSADSSYHYIQDPDGAWAVPIENVVGRALVVSWPANHWTWLDNYPLTFAEVDDARVSQGSEK